ncbi:ParB N-terminal domain-containing protein [Streptomyces griseus]|uniref:ParB/RepB/Spo0J family partition protein n=3 Tax=Streptomyces TaxID=1883 RepID=UPI0001C18D9C|nr:ParB N-terminal domain-containing protein [Streptomyces sp. SID4928]
MEHISGNSPEQVRERSAAVTGAVEESELKLSAVTMVPVESLLPSDSPRSAGEDVEHIRTLAASGAELPAIVVMPTTKRVIDGMHRLRATKMRGATEIAVRYFEGGEEEAFIFAVKSNVTHGLPLSLDDRKVAATRVLETHPSWSDRAIGLATGLSAKTVGTLRSCSTAGVPQSNVRIGRDGRARPLDPTEGRKLASRLLQENPSASLRQIAAQAGVSPSTASDVRKRLSRGESPLPERDRQQEVPAVARTPARVSRADGSWAPHTVALRHLSRDPSVRLTEDGRALLRWLNVVAVRNQDWDRLLGNVPPHCVKVIAELARGCADIWHRVAEELDQAGIDEAAGRSLSDVG